MIIYGLLFLLVVAVAIYTLVALLLWVKGPNRRRIVKPVSRALGISSVAWATAFITPFAAELLGSGADTLVGGLWLVTLIAVTIVASRSVPGIWGPISGGAVLAGAVWASAIGIYVMHASGWRGLRLDDLGSDDMGVAAIWVGALFFAPGAFLLGFLLGLVSPRVTWRRPQTPA
ncbi:MAG: hypothetical protein AAB092_09375 [Chloroflexota bacterium]